MIKKGEEKDGFVQFEIVGNLLKTHFKQMTKLAHTESVRGGFLWGFEYNKTLWCKKEDEALLDDLIRRASKVTKERADKSREKARKKANKKRYAKKNACDHGDLNSLGYGPHGSMTTCHCGAWVEIW